jgi:outer membrane protein assembly factor BamB
MVLCLDPANGQKIWQKDYPSHTYQMSPDCNYATASPAADADGVIVTWTTPEEVTLLALDNDGKETWRRNLGPWASKLGSGTSPVIVGDVVFLANEQEEIRNQDGSLKVSPKGFLIGVSRKTGETRWQIDRRAGEFSSYSTPCLRQGEDGRIELVHASNVHGITGLDPATGKIKWEMPGQFQEFVGSAVADAGLVVVRDTHSSKSVRVMAVKPGDSAKGEKPSVIYDIPKRGIAVITPLIKDGRLFVWDGDGTVLCHRAATGEMVWRQRLGARFSGSPVWVNNRLYCISKEGEVFVLSAADKYELLARVPLGEPSFSTPAVAGGVMYLRTRTQLFSLGGKK